MFIAAIAVAAAPSLLLTTSAPASASSTTLSSAASTGLAAAISPGDVSSLSGTQLTNMMNSIAASGATWVRLGAQWAAAEPSSGVYSWNAYDPAIQAAVAAGLQVLFCINGGNAPLPSWAASPSANLNTFASQYAAFAKAAVQRYSVSPFNIHTYEIWNEPNLGSNWGGTASGTQYATVLKSAYSAIKTADASSFVISGGLSPAGNDGTDVSPQTFLTEMYLAGAGGYFDAVGAHPYCFPADPTDSSSASWSFFYNLPNWIYQVMVANGDGAKKVWMTEFGDPTGTDTSDGAVSVQTQAQQLTDAFNQAKQWSWAGPLFWYNWQDGTNASSIYDNFGLVDASGNPKPALSAFESSATSLAVSTSSGSGSSVSSLLAAPANLVVAVEGGTDAIGTSIAVSQAEFPTNDSAKAVVLARSDYFSDALAGGPLAAKVGGPLLITPGASLSSSLDSRVQAEIQRVLPAGDTVYILGGSLALSTDIDGTLQGLGYVTQRIAGGDEYGTAVDVAEQLANPSTIFEVTGLNFPDALSAVPTAIATGGAILLTDGTTQAPETASYLAAHQNDTRYAIGGPLTAYGADPTAIPVYGQDLYGTSAAVASTFFAKATVFGAATGVNFADALSGGVFMGTQAAKGPMLLVQPSGPLPPSVANYLSGVAPTLAQGYLFGGPVAVGADALSELESTG